MKHVKVLLVNVLAIMPCNLNIHVFHIGNLPVLGKGGESNSKTPIVSFSILVVIIS